MHSITNLHLHNDPGAIITFPDETFGLSFIHESSTPSPFL
jgi:hypothetical protein